MPNYSITINSKFQPFSFDRYIQPYQLYGAAYKEQQDALADLEEKASIWENMANSQTDPQAYNTYKSYANDLQEQANLLATEGLNPASRANMLSMKARYNREIAPIQVAFDRRRQLAEEQRKMRASDKSVRFSKDYATASLDDLIKNPEATYSLLSGDDIATRTAAMAEPLAKSLTAAGYGDIFDKQYLQERLQYGYTPEQVMQEILGQEGYSEVLRGIRDTIKSEYSDNPAYDDQWIDSYINRGLFNAIGEAKYNMRENSDYVSNTIGSPDYIAYRKFLAEYEEDPDNPGSWKKKEQDTPLSRLVPLADGSGFADTKTNFVYDNNGNLKVDANGNPIRVGAGKPNPPAPGIEEKEKGLGKLVTAPILLEQNMFQSPSIDYETNFTEDDDEPRLVCFNELPSETKTSIRKTLSTDYPGVTEDDVDIWRDKDLFSDNHYKVVPKGSNPIDPAFKIVNVNSLSEKVKKFIEDTWGKSADNYFVYKKTNNNGGSYYRVIKREDRTDIVEPSEEIELDPED